MVSRRPASVVVALSATIALVGVPAASAQPPGPAGRVVVTELPVLSELPPLPTKGGQPIVDEPEDTGVFGRSRVQTVALVLAASVLVAGGTGLALVTRRGRGEPLEDQPPRTDPVA
ncbi:hypothetical protein [Dietzia cinnamea]|uniref:Uncharacterized protein n=1 Tax=Dietzia cinnamea TaxID=321318 RepID=A0A4R3ZU13_9ACTN|nr:hypothetical protein [Dietzia cinnamea]TCW23896.1 hypothetical protein EDD19_10946 [Dietzia cinnamea]